MTDPLEGLSAREREVMDLVYRFRRVTAEEVRRHMADPPTNATVRSTLRVLEEKGHVAHQREGVRYVYHATRSREEVKEGVLGHVLRTFFDGSVADAVAALVDRREGELDEAERRRIQELLERLEEDG